MTQKQVEFQYWVKLLVYFDYVTVNDIQIPFPLLKDSDFISFTKAYCIFFN